MKIKFSALLLIFVFILAACGETAKPKLEEEEKVIEAVDMDGQTFIFGTIRTNEYFQEEGYSSSGDRMNKRYRETAQFFNCNLEVVKMEDTCSPTILQAIAVMTDVPNFIDCNTEQGYALFKEGALAAYEDISTLDSTAEKWGPPALRANGFFNGKYYGAFPYHWEFIPQFSGILLINNPLIRNTGLLNPYEVYEKKQWTWDTFEEQIKTATYDDGENSYTGFMLDFGWDSYPSLIMQTAMFSNGVRVANEKDGELSFGLNTPAAIDAMNWVLSLKEDGCMKASKDNFLTEFTSGFVPYFLGSSWRATIHIAAEEYLPSFTMDEYGIMPFPNGPANDHDAVNSYIDNQRLIFVVEMTERDIDDTGRIVDYVFAPISEYDDCGWKVNAKAEIFHHDEDFDYFLKITENVIYNYSVHLDGEYGQAGTQFRQIYTSKTTPSAGMTSIEESINIALSKIE